MLPIGAQKSATKLYEQVIIPPADQAPVGVGKNLIPISQLDEVRWSITISVITIG